ncbi:MAG TPA: prolipoprotein diacylglyceryl transferase [Syntrophomonadaceae bacterium]|nr:prolipoprotein diacylglyceryl transferase [Syntrophomonadaceae bacterium]
MHPVLFQIGNFNIYAWGFMLAVAVLIAVGGISRLFKKEGYDPGMVIDMVIILVLVGLFGARLAYIAVYEWQEFLTRPAMFFGLSGEGFSGLIWYGAFIGGFIAFLLYIWRHELPFWSTVDMFAPYLALGYALVRIGCFLNGCCYGLPTTSPLGVVFPLLDSTPRHPTQLYSSALNFLLFFFLIWYFPRRKFTGEIFILYIMGYSLYRFIVEFFRESLIMCGPLTLGQVYTLVLLAFGILLYVLRMRMNHPSVFTEGSGGKKEDISGE